MLADNPWSLPITVPTDHERFSLKGISFTIIAPLEVFATLQRLGLISSWPALPHLLALVPLMPLSPIRAQKFPSGFSLRWCGQLVGSLLVSPLPLWWILFYGKIQVDKRLYACMRLVLPKPDNPDTCSIMGALDDELDNDTIAGLGFIKNYSGSAAREGTLLEELKKDVLDICDGLWRLVNISKWGENRDEEEREVIDFQGIPLVPLQSFNLLIYSAAEVPPILSNRTGPRPATPRFSNRDSPISDSQDESLDPASDNSNLPQYRVAPAVVSHYFLPLPIAPRPDPETIEPPSTTNVTPMDTLQPSNHPSNGHSDNVPSHSNINDQQPIAEQTFPPRSELSTYISPCS